MVNIGEKVADFSVPATGDKTLSLSDFKDKNLVVYFYPKDNTPGCTTEAVDFTCAVEDFTKEDARVVGISPDSEKSHMKFIGKHDLKVTLLSDPEHLVLEQYGAWKEKKMYGKTYMGMVRSTYLVGADGVIAEAC